MRNLFVSAVFAALCVVGVPLAAQAAEPYTELSNPVPVAQPGKVEVVELFWYGCPHCYEFEPTINPWVKQLPDDVHFVRIPAMFGGIWDMHGQLFVTLEAMGVEQKVHDSIFAAIHQQRKRLATTDEMADFLAEQGVDKEAFLKAWNSFGVKSQVQKYKQLAQAYQINGVPTMVVNGKYRFGLQETGGPQQTLDLADRLIDKERAAQ